MPTQFIASALFSVVQPKDAEYLDGVMLASGQGLTINYKGKRLTQVHADVRQGIMHLSRRAPEETLIRFCARTFLRMIGRQTGKSQRDQLHEWITDLQATSVEVLDHGSKRLYFGSLLPEGGRDQGREPMIPYACSRAQGRSRIKSAPRMLSRVKRHGI